MEETKKSNSQRSCCFTIYNMDWKFQENPNVRYLIYQGEVCPQTKNKHFQGYVEFSKKTTLKKMKEILGENSAHIEFRQGTRDQAREYCSNLHDKKKNPEDIFQAPIEFGKWSSGGQGSRTDILAVTEAIEQGMTNRELIQEFPTFIEKNFRCVQFIRDAVEEAQADDLLREEFKDFKPNKFQTEWNEHIDKQNRRQITWVVDEEGGKGKSHYAKYLCSQGWQCFENAKTADIAYALNRNAKGYIFDFSRSIEGRVNYGVMESVKNGRIFSGKYQGKQKVFRVPKMICFSNFYPDVSKFSRDRWDIIDISNGGPGNTSPAPNNCLITS